MKKENILGREAAASDTVFWVAEQVHSDFLLWAQPNFTLSESSCAKRKKISDWQLKDAE